MQLRDTIKISTQLTDSINDLLKMNESLSDCGNGEILFTFTSIIENSTYEVDIKVVNSDSGPYVDAVLFDENLEVFSLEPSFERIDGEYIFDLEDCTITVNVEQQ